MWIISKTDRKTKEEITGEREYDTFARAQDAIRSEYPNAEEIDPGTFRIPDLIVKIVYRPPIGT